MLRHLVNELLPIIIVALIVGVVGYFAGEFVHNILERIEVLEHELIPR